MENHSRWGSAMRELPGYELQQELYDNGVVGVFRAIKLDTQAKVVVKILLDEHPKSEDIARIKHEFNMLQEIDSPGVIKAYSLEKYQYRYALILEDLNAQTLKNYLRTNELSIDKFLEFAIKLAKIINDLHELKIIHKDVNPDNILITVDENIKIIDFSISTRQLAKEQALKNSDALEGSLAYISPEQTGRTNRSVDERTDFYSLGITYYEMLTGQLPFVASDPIEWVHSHIAKRATPPNEIRSDVPQVLSDLVMKLISKQAEDRYATAYGLEYDLLECQKEWQNNRTILPFKLGQKDLLTQFNIPEKLYGREEETKKLLDAYERASNGSTELIIVTGQPGIGKSSLVDEIQKPIVEKRGFFIEGKFDQFQQEIPYSGLLQALRSLVQQILTKNHLIVDRWRADILLVLGVNASILISVIPELELLLGKQPQASFDNPNENQARIGLILVDFIELFAKGEHPLVIFLDDLQWVDSITLNFLSNLLREPDLEYFTLILAYRDISANESVLEDLARRVQKEGVHVSNLHLEPLKITDILNMLTDIFKSSREETAPLADLVYAKTAGNPFFINIFLNYLFQERWVRFDQSLGNWLWNLSAIQTLDVTDNVVDLVKNKIEKLPAETQKIIQYAACIGNQFELKILAKLSGVTEKEAANTIWPALKEQMIAPIGDGYKLAMVEDSYDHPVLYKFSHDRIQQAAYYMTSDGERAKCHLLLGRILNELANQGVQRYQIFDIVYQYNQGSELIQDENEKYNLAKLNIEAGQKALDSTTFEIARGYFLHAYNLLSQNGWQYYYNDMVEALVGLGTSSYLDGKFDEGQKIFDVALTNNLTIFDRGRFLYFYADLLSTQNKYIESAQRCLEALEVLGIPRINPHPSIVRVLIEGVKARRKINTLSLYSLLTTPDETAPDKVQILKIFKLLMRNSFLLGSRFTAYLTFKSLQRIESFGDANWRATCLNIYALIQEAVFKKFKYASELTTIALQLADKSNSLSTKAQVHFSGNIMVLGWTKPIKLIYEDMQRVYLDAKKSGNLFILAPVVGAFALLEILMGLPMTEVLKNLNKNTIIIESSINEWHKQANKLMRKYTSWFVEGFDRNNLPAAMEELSVLLEQSPKEYKLIRALPLLLNLSIFNEEKLALELIEKIKWNSLRPLNNIVVSSILCYFVIGVVIGRTYQNMSLREKIVNKIYFGIILRRFSIKSELNPDSFKAMYECLLCAKYLMNDDLSLAIKHYEITISLAKNNNQIFVEAYVNDMMANFFLQKDQYRTMLAYLKEARYAYQQWGIIAKVNKIQKDYPDVFEKKVLSSADIIIDRVSTFSEEMASQVSASSMLDLATVMKSAQAISSQVEFEELLKILIKILSENAGAQRGILILNDNYMLIVKAEYDAQNNHLNIISDQPIEKFEHISLNIVRYVQRTKKPVILGDASRVGGYTDDPYIVENKPSSILCLPILNQGNLIGILYLENNLTREAFTQNRFEVLRMLSGQAAISIENARLYSAYDQFVPHEFLDLLNKRSIVDVHLGDHVRKNMAVLFSDIRNFTPLSEQMGPVETFQFMNEFLGYMEPIIKKHDGFIDKYIGDAIMALFPNGGEDAVSAAVEMQMDLAKFNETREKTGKPIIRIGIGINSGDLLLGTLGGKKRLQTSVISDAVNVAARLEELTKEYNSYILISDAVYQTLFDHRRYPMRYAFRAQIRGKAQKMIVWEVFAGDPVALREKKMLILRDYEEAVDAYHHGDYKTSLELFERCLTTLPNDNIVKLYVESCNKNLKEA